MKLFEIVSPDLLQEIQDCFASATGFAAITVDFQGKPLLKYSNFSQFCLKLREDEFFHYYCCQSDAHSGLEAVRKGSLCIHRCHAGLIDFAVPIIVDGEYMASVMCGQVKADDDTALKTRLLEQSDDIFTDRPELRALHDKIPVLPVRRIKETAELLNRIVNFIVEQFYSQRRDTRFLEDRKRQEELTRQRDEMEMMLLHARISPHFLFNALNVAGRQAHMEGARKAEDVIYALADMCRYFMRNDEPRVTVERELQNVKNYFFIQKVRFGDLLSFTFDVQPDIRDCLIPSMSLQALVENSMHHGLEKKNGLGYVNVRLRGFKENGMVCFEVSDNGAGASKDRLTLLNGMGDLNTLPTNFSADGIYNLRKRLRYFWENGFKLQFSENTEGGVTARLEIAARKPAQVE
ncbi:MAG: PocR ligand-binding domain-containing protein [Synergistaceae bacterium]|nr:PocR ligand-binding domain-containing protein [Synergistaceae bacterium]